MSETAQAEEDATLVRLIGRRTHFWDTDRTAADLISEQLPKLLTSASAIDSAAVAGLEEHHAEPFSDFYPYHSSMVMVQSDWSIGSEHRRGTLRIGTVQSCEPLPDPIIRGAVLDVYGESGEQLCSVVPSMRRAFSGKVFEGGWARVKEPIRTPNPGDFIKELWRQHPQLNDVKSTHVKDGWLRVWGVLFPEQTAHRVTGEGWVFACALDAKHPNIPQPHFRNPQKKRKHRKKR